MGQMALRAPLSVAKGETDARGAEGQAVQVYMSASGGKGAGAR
ncbi:hypothetical protein E2C01_087691 [Portunus trituberculatus]|uniref:Uncharacterized protein n=1 Tax=Portunus trituberculatus TaxID=210409 RepID=A0A5B7JE18_PORTR|nr:hypothetical protein [Portunus trituberculatus]